LQIFTRRDEALDLVESLAKFLHLNLLESANQELRLVELPDLRRRPIDRPLRIYLAETKPTRSDRSARQLR